MPISPLPSITSTGLDWTIFCSRSSGSPSPGRPPVRSFTPSKRLTLKPAVAPNINKYVALRDSYFASHLAGKYIPGIINRHDCKRYDGSYASQLQRDKGIMDNTSPGSQFDLLACSAFTFSQITDQSFINGANLYTVASGGNDVDLQQNRARLCLQPVGPCQSSPASPTLKTSSLATASTTTSKSSTRRSNKKPPRAPGTPGIAIALPYVRFFKNSPQRSFMPLPPRLPRRRIHAQGPQRPDRPAESSAANGRHRRRHPTGFTGRLRSMATASARTDLCFQGIPKYDPALDSTVDAKRSLSDDRLKRLVDDDGPESALGGGTFHPTVADTRRMRMCSRPRLLSKTRS